MSSMRFEAPTLLDYFAALVADDQQFSLLEAAISVAQDDDPALDVQGVLSQIDSLAASSSNASLPMRARCTDCSA